MRVSQSTHPTDIVTATATDTVADNSGALTNNFDSAAVQKELDVQVQVTQAFDRTQQGVRREINASIDEANKRKENAEAKLKDPTLSNSQKVELLAIVLDAQHEIERLQKVGVLVSTIASGLSSPTDSVGGVLASTLAPGISYQIGQHFKENAARNVIDNGNRGEEGSATHLLAHALLGAVVAASGGNDALIGGIVAAGAEAAAPALAQLLYGKEAKDLNADEKPTISAIVGIGGATIGSLGSDLSDIIANSSGAQNAVDNNWGEVGHYSTMATILYLAGFSEQDAKAVGLAAWSPDTDNRNAITVHNIKDGDNPAGYQQSYHLLDGETDPEKVKAKQLELGQQVAQILSLLKQYEGNPAVKADILSNPDNQKILHAFGDSYAHVKSDGTHYEGGKGHGQQGTDPDDPNRHPDAYANYISALYGVAVSVSGNSSSTSRDISRLTLSVVNRTSEEGQKYVLAEAARVSGSGDPGLVNSPVVGCEWYEKCGENTANSAIRSIYKVPPPPAPPAIDWSKMSFPPGWN